MHIATYEVRGFIMYAPEGRLTAKSIVDVEWLCCVEPWSAQDPTVFMVGHTRGGQRVE